MAYVYIDDDAWPGSTDDAPLASAAVQQMRANLAQIWAERQVRVGHVVLNGEERRLCSVWPCAWPLGEIYVDQSEPTISVTLRILEVGWSVDDAAPRVAGDGVRVGLTAVAYDGRGSGVCPADPAVAAGGTFLEGRWLTLEIDGSPSTVTLTCPTYGAGWHEVLLWIWSYSEDEGLADRDVTTSTPTGTIQVSSLGAIATMPPERAVLYTIPWDKVGGFVDPGLPLYQVEAWEDDGAGAYILELWPPPLYGDTLSDAFYGVPPLVEYWTMGVLSLDGWTVEAVAESTPQMPGEYSVESAAPASEGTLVGLAQVTERLTSHRVAQWGAAQVAPLVNSVFVPDLRWTATELTFPVDGSYTPIAAWLIASPPPLADSAGYEAVVTLQMRHSGGSYERALYQLRLVAREIGSAAPATYLTGSAVGWGPLTQHVGHRWWPAGCGFRLSEHYTHYQHRGALIHTAVAGERIEDQDRPSDMYSVYRSPVVLLADDAAITYPCEIRLEMALNVATGPVVYADISEVCAGLRCSWLEVNP